MINKELIIVLKSFKNNNIIQQHLEKKKHLLYYYLIFIEFSFEPLIMIVYKFIQKLKVIVSINYFYIN